MIAARLAPVARRLAPALVVTAFMASLLAQAGVLDPGANPYRFVVPLVGLALIAYAAHSMLRLRQRTLQLVQALAAETSATRAREQTEVALRQSEERVRRLLQPVLEQRAGRLRLTLLLQGRSQAFASSIGLLPGLR